MTKAVNNIQLESLKAAAAWTGYPLSVVTRANAPHGLTKAIKRIGQPSGFGRAKLARVCSPDFDFYFFASCGPE